MMSTPKTQVQNWPRWNQKWPVLVIASYWWMEMPKVSQGFAKPRLFCKQKAGRCRLWFLLHQDSWVMQWSSSSIYIDQARNCWCKTVRCGSIWKKGIPDLVHCSGTLPLLETVADQKKSVHCCMTAPPSTKRLCIYILHSQCYVQQDVTERISSNLQSENEWQQIQGDQLQAK